MFKIENLLFTSPNGETILFDDFVKETHDDYMAERPYWAEMCPACRKKYRHILAEHFDDGGMGTCSVAGCNNEAGYYVDFFSTDNVKIVEE